MADKSRPLDPGVPTFLQTPGCLDNLPESRLELAKWLVDEKNPLTARVAVNRLWQLHFGVGIVETSENFGSQGKSPTHPELLDWLAAELMHCGWNLQHVQRLILASATYRQSSSADSTKLAKDPQNIWYSRGPRFRMSPFALRDQALAMAGLLVSRTGGPSVKPYMPPKIWSAFSNNKYVQDTGANLFRRSLYTYWRRTIPPPTMLNFNAAAREVCTVRNERTNTPLQALSLLNNIIFVESARHLGVRAHRLHQGDTSQAVATLFEWATAREASTAELRSLLEAYQQIRPQLTEADAKEFLAIGESPAVETEEPIEVATLSLVASLILNLDEVVSKE